MGSSQSGIASDQAGIPANQSQQPAPSPDQYSRIRNTQHKTTAALEVAIPEQAASLESFDIKSHSPIPLTAGQEAQVKEIYYKRVRDKCANEVREFAHCAAGRTFTIPVVCRQQRLAMERCMNGYATRAEEDAAREEWFAAVGKRRRETEKQEKEKEEAKRKHREWWGLDEQGRRKAAAEERSRGN